MAEQMAGFPFWQVTFDAEGAREEPAEVAALRAELATGGVTDLFIFSHGWNNSC